MKVVVSGASGLVGRALVEALAAAGHEVVRLVRRRGDEPGTIFWDPEQDELDGAALQGCDLVVHLAGEPVAEGRWTEEKKSRILLSRTRSTRLLAETMAALENGPRTLISASAIGFYGDRGDLLLAEDSEPGSGFLAEVCARWEAAAEAARTNGLRVVALRIGMVLTNEGGALARMLPPFRLGLGGVVGSGRQWVSWITLEDLVGVFLHVMARQDLAGPVNAVSPCPVPQRQLTKALGRTLRRPTLLPLPEFGARLLFGEMAEELLLASTRVDARRLLDSGYSFRHREIEGALRHLLAR